MLRQEVRFTFDVVVEPDDGGYHAYCPALKGLHTDGSTVEEALQNSIDAAKAYLESLITHDEPIPLSINVEVTETPIVGTRYPTKIAVPVG